MGVNEQLIYVASNSKGDQLFNTIRSKYKTVIYIDSGYHSIKTVDRIVSMLFTFKVPRRRSIKDSAVDLWFRNKIETTKVINKLRKHCVPDGTNDVLLWFPLFPVTPEWKKYGRLSVITDVAMDESYFDNFNISIGKATEMRKNNWNINFANCDYIFTLSKWAMEANKKLHPGKAEKVTSIGWGPNILPPSFDEVVKSSREDRILCIGHDYYRKGVDIFNEVSRRLKRRLSNLECMIVGRPGNTLDPAKLDSLTIHPPATPEQVSLHDENFQNVYALFKI